ncbi:MAG: phage tail tip lysozyme [Candidatus Saccharibacteria bacterium]
MINKHLKIRALLLSGLVIISTPISVMAYDNNPFYNSNDILFYNSSDANCINGPLVGNDNLEKILRYYIGKGLTLQQSAGIAGNYQQESSFDPKMIQGGTIASDTYSPVDGVGFGIAQWTFTSRQSVLVNLAKSSNRKITDLSLQLDFSWQELSVDHPNWLSDLQKTTTPESAAYIFHKDFEGSADSEATVRAVRGGNAITIYNNYKNNISSGTSSCASNGQPSTYINGFAIYNQNDPQWSGTAYGTSTIGRSGCGPSAMAMIVTALTGVKVTPVDTATYGAANGSYVEGSGSSNTIATIIGTHWGLTVKKIGADTANINTILRSGGLIITSGVGSAPFTSSGHFIVIRAVTATDKWMIGDSNSNKGIENSKKEWNPADLITNGMNTDNVWAVTK